eukprot:TRINITY_DN18671_c0_g1_i1.p1 TRINITY_DN18671_c0_g1~~TRINITY_DN18671_c0_g1_i1.p1  ORF type:complete len:398 (+),score=18.44 TRINITY_DN18671_c0_g1_i1:116-1195(+)
MGQSLSLIGNPAKKIKTAQLPKQSLDASLIRIQNMVSLIKDLNLHVQYKVVELNPVVNKISDRELLVIVRVLHDRVFPYYREQSCASDLPLFRGLFLKVQTSNDLRTVKEAIVQQAFLPKFENEGQDREIADMICNEADRYFMVVTIKHSGSLVTLSPVIAGAKNSVDNDFAHSGIVLLAAHYRRLAGERAWKAKLENLMKALSQQRISLSFEAVTGCLGHHGQIPRGEYLVTTSAHTIDDAGQVYFLSWLEFVKFCIQYELPINDSWLVGSSVTANKLRDLLDEVTEVGLSTEQVLQRITTCLQGQEKCIHIEGTYPHEQWQGSRMEGFVISRGQAVTEDLVKVSYCVLQQSTDGNYL